jgi:hypothetical protein
MKNNPNSPGQTPGVQPGLAPAGWLGRIVRYFVRRDITKALKAIKSATRGAQLYDKEAVYRLDLAYLNLYIVRERMRPNAPAEQPRNHDEP